MVAGERLSYLNEEEQAWVLEAAENADIFPSPNQAAELKGLSEQQELTEGKVYGILVKKENKGVKVTIPQKKLQNYFPPTYTKKEIEEVVYSLLEQWKNGKEGETNAGNSV